MLGLAFSGGKDSLACWHLCKDQNPIVFWVNTGKAYPETLEIVNEIRAQAVKFVEVQSDQQANIDEHGIPSDVVPINWTSLGMIWTGQKPIKIQSYLGCCYENISRPLIEAVRDHGITQLIRGQRNDESHKSTARSGDFVLGVEYLQPIENWTKEEVLAYLMEQRGSLPKHFDIEHSSLDCYDCTGFAKKSKDRVAYTKEHHPELHLKYQKNMDNLQHVLNLEKING